MHRQLKIFFFVLFLLSSGACEKAFISPDKENTPTNCFDSMWERLDEKYAFFDYKHINWDSVKNVYRPKVYDNMSDQALFKVLDNMLYTLRDGHVNLVSPFNVSRNWQWYLGYPQNFDRGLLERNYWGNNYYLTGPFVNVIFKKGNKYMGYLYYGDFSNGISDYDLDFVLTGFKDTDGLIIDLRDNGGGITTNVYQFMSRFVNQKTLVGYNYEKTGNAHDDFSSAYQIYADPAVDNNGNARINYLNKPIILLTNRSCFSACNMFAGFMSVLPNVTIIGDQTGGGGGLPTSYQLPNGWTYRFSSTYTTLPNGLNIEGGIPPNIKTDMDSLNIAAGKDDILNKAFAQF